MCWLQQSVTLWSYPTFLLVPLILIGAVECFAGYWAWRFLLGLNGAVLGLVTGAALCVLLRAPLLIPIGALGGGVAGAIALTAIRPLGTFIFAFGSSTSLAILLAHAIGVPTAWISLGAVAAGLAAAVAALAGSRPFMVGLCAVGGAQQIASAWRARQVPYGEMPSPEAVTASELAAFVIFAAAGLAAQAVCLLAMSRRTAHAAALPGSQPAGTPHACE